MNVLGCHFRKVLFTTLVFIVGFQTAHAEFADNEVEAAKNQLKEILTIIETISPYVERMDMARLFVIRRKTEEVLKSIEEKGLAHAATFQLYQHLIVGFRFSSSFLRQIVTERTEKQIERLITINEEIIKARGFDDSPYTQITASVFTQMHKLILQLCDGSTIPDELRQRLEGLVAPIGRVIAVAKEGDRPRTFAAAEPVYRQIEALYPAFDKIMRANAAFEVIMEIQGLNEFYAEFAQIEATTPGAP